jgi:hypothetical protein
VSLAEKWGALSDEQRAQVAQLAADLVPGGLDRVGALAEAFLGALPPAYREQLEHGAGVERGPDLLSSALARYGR